MVSGKEVERTRQEQRSTHAIIACQASRYTLCEGLMVVGVAGRGGGKGGEQGSEQGGVGRVVSNVGWGGW